MRPEVIPKSIDPLALPRDLVLLERLARLLDEAVAVPGTKKRVGLDPLIGLIPGIGDALAALLGAGIVVGAVRHRLPTALLVRMAGNVLLDTAVGAVPFLGDVFDVFYHGNAKNARLVLEHRDRTKPPRTPEETLRAGGLLLAAFVVLILLALVGVAALSVWLVRAAF